MAADFAAFAIFDEELTAALAAATVSADGSGVMETSGVVVEEVEASITFWLFRVINL